MSEIDPEIEARWRAASREEPPTTLDDAIRAAARREVGARPGRFRPAPLWWPLAAAATVAAVAVGIVQMTPPEQVAPAAFPPMNASRPGIDTDAAKPTDNSLKRDGGAAAVPEAPQDTPRMEFKPAAKDLRRRAIDENPPAAADSVGRFAAAPSVPAQEKKTSEAAPARAAEEPPEREQLAKQKSEVAAASAALQSPAIATAPAPSIPRNERQPFPASPLRPEVASSNAPTPSVAAEGAASPPLPPAPARAAQTLTAQSSAPAAPASSVAGNVAGGLARRGAETSNADSAKDAAASGKVASSEADQAAPAGRKDAVRLSPDEWIKRIRRLIAEGRNAEAAKELAAFRREYRERSDALLPSDLRSFRQ